MTGKSRFCIYLLGLPRVSQGEIDLSIPRRNVRGLLYYLAFQSKPVSRDHLTLLFWPDMPESSARRNLTHLLAHLRRALPTPDALVTSEEQVFLNRTSFWCDVAEFHRLGSASTHDQTDLVNMLQCADLYTGPLLDGFNLPDCPEYESWLFQAREELERQFLAQLSALVEVRISEGNFSGAIEFARRYLQIDDLSEEMHRKLIGLYALAGDRTRALRQYEKCISILENELGARPLPETQAIYKTVLEGRVPQLSAESLVEIVPVSLKTLCLDGPMVGRLVALDRLEKAMHAVKIGGSRVVFVSGEAGIGKSRLLFEFSRRHATQSRILFGAGQPGEAMVPYHPVVEALRPISVVTTQLPPMWLAEVSRLLPELSEQFPDLPPPFNLKGDEARLRLFDALCRYVIALQEESGTLALLFDDLHWFDATSLSWLVHLVRQLQVKNHHILLVCTTRSEDAADIQELHANIARLGFVEDIKLTGLDAASVYELFLAMFGDCIGGESLSWRLQEATGGNPFFIHAILQALAEEGRLHGDVEKLEDLPLPESVRDIVGRRIEGLDERWRQVLEAGAILDAPFAFKTLQLTSGRSELETSLSLDQLLARQLLIEESGGYRFYHDLVRRVACGDIPPVRQQILHARAAKALVKLEPEAANKLARHFDSGGEFKKALHYYGLAAQRSEALFAWQETELYLKRILEILEMPVFDSKDKTATMEQRGHALMKLRLIHNLQGKFFERDEDLRQLENLFAVVDNIKLKLLAIEVRVRQLNSDAQYREAIAEAEKGLQLIHLPRFQDVRGRLLSQMGLAHLFLGQPNLALDILQQARACIPEDKDPEFKAMILTQLGMVHRMNGDYQQALKYLQDAFACHRQLGDPYSNARYTEIGYLLTSLGRYAEAKLFLDECLAVSRRAGVRAYEGHALLALGGWHMCQGDPNAAVDTYHQAVEILETLRNQNLTASAQASLGFAYYRLAEFEPGRKWLAEGLELARKIGHQMRIAEILIELSLLNMAEGNLQTAAENLESGMSVAVDAQSRDLHPVGLVAAARLARFSGSFVLASQKAEKALEDLQTLNQPVLYASLKAWALIEAGLGHAMAGQPHLALERTSAAVLLIPESNQSWIGFEQVYLAHANSLRGCGDLHGAEEHEQLALSLHRSKSIHISDPYRRKRFREAYEKELSLPTRL